MKLEILKEWAALKSWAAEIERNEDPNHPVNRFDALMERYRNPKDLPYEFDFDKMNPRKIRNKESGLILKCHPWFEPISDSRSELKGVLSDLLQEELLKNSDEATQRFVDSIEFYTGGILIRKGWLFRNPGGVYLGLPIHEGTEKLFEDIGPWTEEDEAEPDKKEAAEIEEAIQREGAQTSVSEKVSE